MKKSEFTEIICKGFCSYYKPGREKLTCGAYEFLRSVLSPQELRKAINGDIRIFLPGDFSICERCSFRIDGCDFYAGLSDKPCGGYRIISLWTGSR